MQWLRSFLQGMFGWLIETLASMFTWVKSVPMFFLLGLVSWVFIPIGMVFDFVLGKQISVIGFLDQIEATVENLHFDEWAGYWAYVVDAAKICNVFLPLDLAFAITATLISLWILCMGVRVIIRLLGIISGG